MDYIFRAKFGDRTFSRFGFIVRTNTQTHRITDAAERLTHATIVCVSKVASTHAAWQLLLACTERVQHRLFALLVRIIGVI